MMKPDALTVNKPFATPFALGVKTMATVQPAPGASVVPHEFAVRLNGGEVTMLRPPADVPLVLEMVATWAALG